MARSCIWCYDHGLEPGAAVELKAAHPDSDQLVVTVSDRERALDGKVAEGLFVRRD